MAAPHAGASSISVAVRVRPFTIREAAQLTKTDDGTLFLGDGSMAAAPAPKLNQKGLRSVIKVVDDRCLVFDPPEDNPVQKFTRSVVPAAGKRVKDQVFAFDRIFDDNASQMDVYEGTTKCLLDSVLDGYNATVFAYGATGCGKTHTITGTAQQPGIIFMTMQELFEKINERSDEKHTELTLSYLEIYNETIRDLLVPNGSKQGLMLREDTNQAVTVAGLTSHHPRDVQEVMDMIVQGNEYRTVSPTEANAVSSRSHAVLQINVAQRDKNANVNEPHTMATLSIIDLAGSERASATKNRGDRLLEGANINKSLLALGGCINALCDPRKKNHVPYRNSKLTRLLKFSLGGNCKTVMIVCVSPSSAHFDETQNTLRYANRAKNIQTKVTRNVFNVNRHVKDFLVKIDEQMAMINELKAQQKDAEKSFGLRVRKQLDKRDAIAREGIQRIRVAYENSLPERQKKVSDMKKLRMIERRLVTLTAWGDSFDMAQDSANHGSDDAPSAELPSALAAMRKTARGIMAELEHSRNHLHQKIERSNWERPLDSALQHSVTQLTASTTDSVAADVSEAVASLTRETELLKANFAREAYLEVVEQEKTTGAQSDMVVMQTLLSAQFEIITSLTSTLSMPRDEAVGHGQRLIRRLIDAGVAAASQIVKPDPSFSASFNTPVLGAPSSSYMVSPSKKGTPRRKARSSIGLGGGGSRMSIGSVASFQTHLMAPPTKSSPRRRKVGSVGARPRVSFGATKKKFSSASSVSSRESISSSFKRSVRWRDDETEQGTLADFEKTPQKHSPAKKDKANISIVIEAPEAETEDEKESHVAPEQPRDDKTSSQHTANEASWTTMETVLEEASPSPQRTPELPRVALPSYLSRTDVVETDEDDDSSLNAPEASTLPGASMPLSQSSAASSFAAKPSRFQAGFLTKTRPSLGPMGNYASSSDAEQPAVPKASSFSASVSSGLRKSTPLRNISVPRAANQQLSPPSATRIASLSRNFNGSPKVPSASKLSLTMMSTTTDENTLPATRLRSPSPRRSLDSDNTTSNITMQDLTSTFDTQKLRSALHSAKKAAASSNGHGHGHHGHGHNGSSLGNAAGARRFSIGAGAHHQRASASYGGSSLSSSTNGISRPRRKSSERRRSPPMACSSVLGMSDSVSGSGGLGGHSGHGSMTPGQARRMNMGGSLRWDSSSGSPRDRAHGREGLMSAMEPPSSSGGSSSATASGAGKPVRRVTIGTAAMGGLGGSARKEARTVAWR
ncbi:kinesin-like protein [Ophiostoma piceae UAMH 11346]|uniref:Kinesin-like protein n=1 Tax=Ophiostoma piceae (strain UAMH 11346) TaxID=1262450 RepID=S3D8L3_OPHP1|nr:kinesin-like protein [Ophiostoma piceae UAMH 11346]